MAREWWDILRDSWKRWLREDLSADPKDGSCHLTIQGERELHAVIHYEKYYSHGEQHHDFSRGKQCDRAVVRKQSNREALRLTIDLVEFKRTRRHIDDAAEQLIASKRAIESFLLADAVHQGTLKFRLFCAHKNASPKTWKQRQGPQMEILSCGDELPSLPPLLP